MSGETAAVQTAEALALLGELRDRQEIGECLRRYCRGLDRHDAELAKSAYHDDARDDHAFFVGSGFGLVEWAEERHSYLRSHLHYIANESIELDGDVAHVETYILFAGVPRDSEETILGGGRYVDRLERRDGRWGIVDRICLVEWGYEGTLAARLAAGIPASQDRHDPSYRRPLRVDRADRILD